MTPHDSEVDKWFQTLRYNTESSDKSWTTAFLLSLFLGLFGADRIYLGHPLLGTLKLCTLGFFGFGYIVDIVLLLLGVMKDSQGKVVRRPF